MKLFQSFRRKLKDLRFRDGVSLYDPAYHFTSTYFEEARARLVWKKIFSTLEPSRVLEIGCFEGRSTCYVIEKLASRRDIELHCVDIWGGEFEERFHHNINLAKSKVKHAVKLVIHKGFSDKCLAKLLAEGKQGYFDFIYIDGSHQAPDVLCDAVMSFQLLKKGGVLGFDDYLWSEPLSYGIDPIRCPKLAIDVFTNIYCRKLKILRDYSKLTSLWQLYVEKLED